MAAQDQNLDDFLNKIDALEDIVKGFKSKDEATASQAMVKADKLLETVKSEKVKRKEYDEEEGDEVLPKTKTGFSKTSINKSCSDHPAENDVNCDNMDQTGFLKALEADANERAERRKARGKVADALKEKGNAEFRQGNYEQALDFYTQALQEVKDTTALYTNRAQTYIKLGKYSQAIVDCDWALRVFPNCLKAYIHQGRAHLGLKEYQKARDSYIQALACDPKKQALIAAALKNRKHTIAEFLLDIEWAKDYQAEVDRAERAEMQEKEANEKVNPEDPDVPEMLTGVQKPNQQPLYYSGGFRVITSLLVTTKDRTLFRTNGGLDIMTSHVALNKCLTATPKTIVQAELDMAEAAFKMLTEACRDNEKSTEVFLQKEELPKTCMKFLEAKLKGQGMMVKVAIVTCLCTLSQTEIGRRSIIATFDVPKLLAVMFTLIRTTTKTATPAANLLNNLALENKFKGHLRDKLEDYVCPAFESLLNESKPVSVLPQCVSMVTNLSSDETIRAKLGGRKPLWEGCIKLVTSTKQKLNESSSISTLDSVLGLLLNITTVPSQNLREFGVNICDSCLGLIKDGAVFPGAGALKVRALGVMSNVVPQCIPAADFVVEKGGTEVLLEFIKDNNMVAVKCALKCLTACTQINEEARKAVVAGKGLGSLIRLLGQTDEVIVGNAALCLSHCTQVHKVCTALTKTDIIKDLLVLARDGKRPSLQQNCAILIAKLAQGDSKHLERLRELHGTEILHSCMKYLKL